MYVSETLCLFVVLYSVTPEDEQNPEAMWSSIHNLHSSPMTLVNTQNVSVTKIVDSSSIQRAETKFGLRIQFLALVFMIHEVWLNA